MPGSDRPVSDLGRQLLLKFEEPGSEGIARGRAAMVRQGAFALLAPVGAWVIFVLGFGLPFKLY